MFEGLTPSDDFAETGEFDPAIERVVPSIRVPIGHNGEDFALTPGNTAVRLFDEEMADYTRVVVYMEDGSIAPFKPDDGLLKTLVHSGFPVELPSKLDETDKEFIDGFMRVWTEHANAELENLL